MKITQKLKMVLSQIQSNCATKECVSCKLFDLGNWQCIVSGQPKNWAIEKLDSIESVALTKLILNRPIDACCVEEK